jgi:hypothetical protein
MNQSFEGNSEIVRIISGIVKAEDEIKMKRMIFRVSKGTAVVSFYSIKVSVIFT